MAKHSNCEIIPMDSDKSDLTVIEFVNELLN